MSGLLILACMMAAGGLIYFWQPRDLLRMVARRNPDVTFFVPASERVVALTIDDGPHPQVTPAILDALARNEARATFFLIGERARTSPDLVSRMRLEGHELGNHCCTDYPAILLRASEFERQVLMVDQLIGTPGEWKWYRPGSAWFSRRMVEQLKAHGYRLCLGSVYPHDTRLRSTPLISRYILHRVFPGAIIVLHDGKADRIRTAGVLERVLPELARRGYRVVTVSELMRAGRSSGAGS